LLQYYSNAQAGGTQFRRIAVTLPGHPELRVRARQGYYPKSAVKSEKLKVKSEE